MAQLPAHPRLAHLLMMGQRVGLQRLACDMAGLLSERNLAGLSGVDISLRLELLRGERRAERQHQGVLARIKQQAEQFKRVLTSFSSPTSINTQRNSASCR